MWKNRDGHLWLDLYRDGLCTLLEYQERRYGGMLSFWRLVFWRWLIRKPGRRATPSACKRFNERFSRRHLGSFNTAVRKQMDWANCRRANAADWNPVWIPTESEYRAGLVFTLADGYVNGLLTQPLGLRASVVPVELTSCKRANLRLKRAIRGVGHVSG